MHISGRSPAADTSPPTDLAAVGTSGHPDRPDLVRAERAAADFLAALGIPLDAEATARTPYRMTRAFAEVLTPRAFRPTTFANIPEHHGIVIGRGLPLRTLCEHHMLPFLGTVDLGYVPDERVLGLSKLARAVEHVAARPQVQERLTEELADWLERHLRPRAVAVVVRAEHTCMTMRGVRARGADTRTSTYRGQLSTDPELRREFLASLGGDH